MVRLKLDQPDRFNLLWVKLEVSFFIYENHQYEFSLEFVVEVCFVWVVTSKMMDAIS